MYLKYDHVQCDDQEANCIHKCQGGLFVWVSWLPFHSNVQGLISDLGMINDQMEEQYVTLTYNE